MTSVDVLRLVAIANPVPPGSLDEVAAGHVSQLLEQLRGDQSKPNAIAGGTTAGRGRRHLRAIAAMGIAVVATSAAVALADNGQPFTSIAAFVGIGSAHHAQTGRDALDPRVTKIVQLINNASAAAASARTKQVLPRLLPTTARLVGHLPEGSDVYLVENTKGDLCVLTTKYGALCTHPLSGSDPITVAQMRRNSTTAPVAWGLARNGITSISFRASGRQVTVPVENNVWFYVGHNNALGSLTIHYANGKSRTIRHGR